VAPILIFIGLEITAQAFEASPVRHGKAVAIAFLPVIANLLFIEIGNHLSNLGKSAADLTGEVAVTFQTIMMMGNGFILSSLLWGATAAYIIDRNLRVAGLFLMGAGALSLFGMIHSPFASGEIFLPWRAGTTAHYRFFAAYLISGVLLFVLDRGARKQVVPNQGQKG
jgi:AGZA family xanthine/uracil permease-like MFS transporter